MATFTTSFQVAVSVNEANVQVWGIGTPSNVTINSTGTFASGEMIDAGGFQYKYIGSVENGWIGYQVDINQYWLLTTTSPSNSIPFNYSTESLTICFLAGTRIATPLGDVAVEELRIADLVLTADGRAAPVRWVGVQTVVGVFADPLRSFPVRITAGALGAGLPVRDLLVSPDHALFLDDALVQAGALVNGTTIVRESEMAERFTYFHVELDDHALILAEGVPAETFVDNVTRRRFDNFADYEALYGDTGATIAEMDTPRIKSARQLPQALRERLGARMTAEVPDAA